MNYDVQMGNIIHRGISYAELVSYPIEVNTLVRRGNGDWMRANDCVELTHVLTLRPDSATITSSVIPNNSLNNSQDEYAEYEESETAVFEIEENDPEEERILTPTAEYFMCKQKRKAAIIGVCTLGLAGLSLMGMGNTWRNNIFAGTSFSANAGIGFVLKCMSFCLLMVLIAIPYFIYSVFAVVYYSIRLNNLKR